MMPPRAAAQGSYTEHPLHHSSQLPYSQARLTWLRGILETCTLRCIQQNTRQEGRQPAFSTQLIKTQHSACALVHDVLAGCCRLADSRNVWLRSS